MRGYLILLAFVLVIPTVFAESDLRQNLNNTISPRPRILRITPREEPAPCLRVMPGNSNARIPEKSELPSRPESLDQFRSLFSNVFGGADSTPENYYQVMTPSGEGCRAKVEQRCGDELVKTVILPAEGGVIDEWIECQPERTAQCSTRGDGSLFGDAGETVLGDDCRTSDPNKRSRVTVGCLSGRYSGYTTRTGRLLENGVFVFYAADNPSVENALAEIEVQTEGGRHTAADIEYRRVGDTPFIWLGRFPAGQGGLDLDGGEEYEIKATGALRHWSGTLRIDIPDDHTRHFVVRLDTPPPATANTPDPSSIAESPGKDFPQAEGQLCDANDRPIDLSGPLKVRGVSQYHKAEFHVSHGRYTLFGLPKGRYLLRYSSPSLQAEQVIDIPFKLVTEGSPPSPIEPSKRKK